MRKDRSRPSRYTQPDLVCPGGNTSQRVSARHSAQHSVHETLVTQRSGQRTDQRSTERRTNHTCTEQRSPRVYEIATRRTLSAGHSARRSDRTSHRQAIRTLSALKASLRTALRTALRPRSGQRTAHRQRSGQRTSHRPRSVQRSRKTHRPALRTALSRSTAQAPSPRAVRLGSKISQDSAQTTLRTASETTGTVDGRHSSWRRRAATGTAA